MTTNNRMERKGVIEGLKALKRPCRIELFTDSEYVRQGLLSWMAKWKKNDWQRRSKKGLEPVKNVELWQRLDKARARHQIDWRWVRGHAGHAMNERADRLAREAIAELRRR